jgi:hypothetical protein
LPSQPPSPCGPSMTDPLLTPIVEPSDSWCTSPPPPHNDRRCEICGYSIHVTPCSLIGSRCSVTRYMDSRHIVVWQRVRHNKHHHHHKHQGLDPLIRSISRVTTAHANVSSVFQLFSFLVVCSYMISKGFGLVAFFASVLVKASYVSIRLSCLVCIHSVVHGVGSRLFCGHKGCNLPEVSITSFLPRQFFVSVRLSESNLQRGKTLLFMYNSIETLPTDYHVFAISFHTLMQSTGQVQTVQFLLRMLSLLFMPLHSVSNYEFFREDL